jgi:hypothetical protein
MSEKTRKSSLKVVGNDVDRGTTVLQPPRPLDKAGKALWDRVVREYCITDAGGIELLCLAAEALDRAESVREAIDRDGQFQITRHGLKDHPGLKFEVANRALVSRLLGRLGLDVEPIRGVGRPGSGGLGISSLSGD